MDKDYGGPVIGVSFWGLLTIVFIALKLMGYIKWSWAWVFAPIWIPALITFVVVGILLVAAKIRGDL